MSNRQGSPSKGKGPAQDPGHYDDNQSEVSADLALEFQSQLQALQQAQVNQAITANNTQKKLDSLEQNMTQLLAAINKVLAPQVATSTQPTIQNPAPAPT